MTQPTTKVHHWRRLVGGWQSVPGQWPRRLLHIPSMTSIERQPGNYYLDEHEPAYSILTYTWGRWRIEDGPFLVVNGVTWKIPSVDENKAFTVPAFQRVIQKMGESTTWAWIDVACIDQNVYAIKMDEIGRQVGIFANATRVYAWLWRIPGHELQAALDNIAWSSVYLTPHDYGPVELGSDLLQVLTELSKSIQAVLGDWWFSSLWTLQEGILRRDAVLMGQDGRTLQHEVSGSPIDMLCRYLYSSLWHVHQQLTVGENRAAYEAPPLKVLVDDITQRISFAGYSIDPFANNPNLQYAAAAARVASYDLDRIYGILSIYNLRVGASVPGSDPSKIYELEELENEFAATLNAFSPLLGQMFIHTKKPRIDRSWQITQHIRIPRILNMYHIEDSSTFVDSKIIGAARGYAQIKGMICAFSKLSVFWRSLTKHNSLNITIDDYICKENANLPFFGGNDYPNPQQDAKNAHTTAAAVLAEFPPGDLTVFALGRRNVEKPLRDPNTVGLILLHSSQDRRRCERLGVCVWDTRAEGLSEDETSEKPTWVLYEGDLY